ncbi:glycosyltransferase family 39 protein [Candidatus Obscuribacterales bacterium]|nr:glycosyltransferase family 39 protein [Candidatus Obscuribacterales bacterium]
MLPTSKASTRSNYQQSAQVDRSKLSDLKLMSLIVVVGCLMFLPALGATGILNTTDAYYAEAAREMLNRGDFITPYLNYEPYYFKPILTYWVIIASYLTFGINTFASRLPSALSCIATSLAIFSLTKAFIGRRAALMAALALLSMPLVSVVGHVSIPDTPLLLLTTVSSLLLLGALIRGDSKGLIPAYACLGLAMLSKGPLALAFVGACVGGFLLVSSRSLDHFKQRLLSLKPILAVAVSLLVALPWFAAVHLSSNGAFTQFFFIQQNFGRLSGQFQSHNNPAWFYVPYLAGGFLPWLPMLLSAPVILRPRFEKRLSDSPRVQMTVASLCWLFGTLGLLLVSSSKVAHYLLPIASPIAILSGLYFDAVLKLGRRRFVLWVAPVMVLACVGGLFAFPRLFENEGQLQTLASVFVSLLIVGYTAYGAFIYKSQMRLGVALLFAWSLLDCGLLVPVAIQQTYRRANEEFVSLVKQASKDKNSVIAVRANDSATAAFYAGKKIYEIEGPLDCKKIVDTTQGPHYFIFDDKTNSLLQPFIPGSPRVISTDGKWNLILVENDAASSSSN